MAEGNANLSVNFLKKRYIRLDVLWSSWW